MHHYQLEKEGRVPKLYSVKVFALSGVALAETNELSNNNREKYKTPPYETTTEAFTHAYGWVNCNPRNQTDSDENGDSWKKAYKKLRENQEEFSNSLISEEKLEPHMEEEKAWKEKLERAYKAGWEIKLQQFSGN